jgi:hypothetical protein
MQSKPYSIKDVDTLRYRPSKVAEEFLSDLRSVLGLSDKASAARLALGRSLYDGGVDLVTARADLEPLERGTAIQGMHLFGEDTAAWACAVACSIGTPLGSDSDLRSLIEYHWHRGAALLEQDWNEAERSPTNFVVHIAGRLSGLRARGGSKTGANPLPLPKPVSTPVGIQPLRDHAVWAINAAGGNGLTVISGSSGRGKSQLAFDMLAQAAAQGVRILFFDLKGELEDSSDDDRKRKTREQFLAATNAEYIRLIDSRLPINPFLAGGTPAETAQIGSEIANLARCYASQLGANQEKAIRDAYQQLAAPDVDSLATALENAGSNGVGFSIIDKLRSFRVFADSRNAEGIDQWLSRSRVIDFKGLGNDTETKSLIVAFILNVIMRRLSKQLPVQNGVQPLQMILFVDEAHLILPKEGKAGLLGALARQGRSWGFPLWLASQDADAFITRGDNGVDFTALADCGVHLSPATLSEADQRAILGQVIHKKVGDGEGVLRLKGSTTIGAIRQFYADNGEVVRPG